MIVLNVLKTLHFVTFFLLVFVTHLFVVRLAFGSLQRAVSTIFTLEKL